MGLLARITAKDTVTVLYIIMLMMSAKKDHFWSRILTYCQVWRELTCYELQSAWPKNLLSLASFLRGKHAPLTCQWSVIPTGGYRTATRRVRALQIMMP